MGSGTAMTTVPTGPCDCPCHTGDVVHVAPCCCQHQYPHGECPACDLGLLPTEQEIVDWMASMRRYGLIQGDASTAAAQHALQGRLVPTKHEVDHHGATCHRPESWCIYCDEETERQARSASAGSTS